MLKDKQTAVVKKIAIQLGFDFCGIATAEPLTEDAKRLEKWLLAGFQGKMQYMENHFDLRVNPQLLVPGAKSVITLLKNYYPSEKQSDNAPKIAKYAYGADYHLVIRPQLLEFIHEIKTQIGAIEGRGFVDSAPILERAWAVKSGLGWVGKNGNLINKQSGSFFFIATLICDLELIPDAPFAKDYCGTCTKCIDSCPTDAILPNKVVDGSRCISYFTIELKEAIIPSEMKGKFDGWMFGCDTCQDVCPWNRFSTPHHEPKFNPIPEVLHLSSEEWETLSSEAFTKIFGKSALKRTKHSGILRNVQFIR